MTNIIIDTDPGIDDAVALLLASAARELNVLGITTVAGNVSQTVAFENTHRLMRAAKADTSVYRGLELPVSAPLDNQSIAIHACDGIGDVAWPEADHPQPESLNAVEFIIKTALAHKDDPFTLCMLGPLTNLALALAFPGIQAGLREVVIMGGALAVPGNTTEFAEFNFITDPVAASLVFRSDLNITLCPLDVTQTLILQNEWLEKLQKSNSVAARLTRDMLAFYQTSIGAALHDPCVIAWLLLGAECFTTKKCNVVVEPFATEKKGQCSVEWSEGGKVQAIMGADTRSFFDLLYRQLSSLP